MSRREIGTLARGLQLLRLINQLHPVRVRDLAEASGIHKATVSRVVATLIEQGYVAKADAIGGFVPTSKVHELSVGINNTEWIFEVAAPELDRLARIVQWPSDFAILQGRGMSIQYSTRRTAPLNDFIQPINVYNIPMFDSEFGLALLAWAAPAQRQALVSALDLAHRKGDGSAKEPPVLERTLRDIRERGYAVRGPRYRFAKANSIAVGIVLEEQCIAAFNLLCKKKFTEPEIARLYLTHLVDTSERISDHLKFDGVRIVKNRLGAV